VISLIDDSGRALSPELTQIVFVQLALEQLGIKRVAIPVTSPATVAKIIRDNGGEVIWTKTEHHAMMASATDAQMVAGSRGEFIFSDFIPAYDGMFAAVKLLEALARANVRLRGVADRHPELHMRQQRVSCPWGRKGTVMRRLMEETENENRQLVDGVKVWKNEFEWVLVIPHSHKPYFVVTVEGATPAAADDLLTRYARYVETWRDET
jgi:mannose-1-phosphate guanylyltransferase/phosphomannomutase